jgi:hypothetical protein
MTVFDPSNTIIGTVNTTIVAIGKPIFVGFSSLTPIASIDIADDTSGGELMK